jgi:hypothetical protein
MTTFSTAELAHLCAGSADELHLLLPVPANPDYDWDEAVQSLAERGVLDLDPSTGEATVAPDWAPLLGLACLAPRITTICRQDSDGLMFMQFLRTGSTTLRHRMVGRARHELVLVDPDKLTEQFEALLRLRPGAAPSPDAEPIPDAACWVVTDQHLGEDGIRSLDSLVLVDDPGRGYWLGDRVASDGVPLVEPTTSAGVRAALAGFTAVSD